MISDYFYLLVDTAGKIVAHAFFPDDIHRGQLHFDANEAWTVTATKGRYSLHSAVCLLRTKSTKRPLFKLFDA